MLFFSKSKISEPNKVFLRIFSPVNKGRELRVVTWDALTGEKIYVNDRINNRGKGTYHFGFEEERFGSIIIDSRIFSVFLGPGCNLEFKVHSFLGDHSEVNHYLLRSNEIRKRSAPALKNLLQMSLEDFIHSIETLEKNYQQFQEEELINIRDQNFHDILKTHDKTRILTGVLAYIKRNFDPWDPVKMIPDQLKEYFLKIPLDAKYIRYAVPGYTTMIDILHSPGLYLKRDFYQDPSVSDVEKNERLPLLYFDEIEKKQYSNELKEYLQHVNAKNWFSLFGINAGTDKLFQQIRSNYGDSDYFPVLKKRYLELSESRSGFGDGREKISS